MAVTEFSRALLTTVKMADSVAGWLACIFAVAFVNPPTIHPGSERDSFALPRRAILPSSARIKRATSESVRRHIGWTALEKDCTVLVALGPETYYVTDAPRRKETLRLARVLPARHAQQAWPSSIPSYKTVLSHHQP